MRSIAQTCQEESRSVVFRVGIMYIVQVVPLGQDWSKPEMVWHLLLVHCGMHGIPTLLCVSPNMSFHSISSGCR